MREPARLGDVLRGLLGRLGVPDPDLWNRIEQEWESLAGEPWDRLARPLALTGHVLVVEARSPAAVGMLRYGTAGLKARLDGALGLGVVTEVRVRAPGRRDGE